ncbi:DUF4905 domain-containing protein [Dyadobacter sediminis]|uniref:DUF4905 domain-containing protein n=1 Tax=Dyadobacter sediminis TaxID=1493691 RepID=UPI0014869B67|nr:DUF4905 domain-containing protein [Dyadobacter sediminis]GGB99707.1 hypothetical protein GCM10011325_28680 [Dyadobacter sediminis]
MHKIFSHPFSQNIWRILPDPDADSNLWAIELREAEGKKVSFAVADVAVQQLLWHNQPEGTDWWTSLTAFSGKQLFLHNYRYPELPEPTDLLAVNAANGQTLWVLPNYLMVKKIAPDRIEVATKAGEQFRHMSCNAETGEIMPLSGEYKEQSGEIILKEPVRYKQGNPYFDQLGSFIKQVTGGHVAVNIDYLEKRPYIMFSYYIYEQDKAIQYLLIVTNNKQIVLHEQLSEERKGIGRSTMMLKASTLVYLKNNNEFSSLTFS